MSDHVFIKILEYGSAVMLGAAIVVGLVAWLVSSMWNTK